MLTALLVGFQLIVTIFISIFARNDSSTSTITTYHPLYSNCAVLTLAFTLIYAPLRKLPLYSLASLLLTIGATVQSYLLLATFWDSCFQGFNSTFTVDTTLIVRSLFASLTVLLTALDFLGIFCYWQVYLIMAPIITFGSALTGAILIRGLKIFDGGGGLLVFLYSGVTSLVIWGMLIKDNIPPSVLTPRKSYIDHTLGLVGVTLLFINWPKYNAAGSLVSYLNVDTTSITTDILMNSAIVNTFLALSISTLLAFLFAQKESENDKMSFNSFSECIINGGISVASFQDVAMDPVAAIAIAGTASLLTLAIERKVKTMSNEGGLGQLLTGCSRIVYRILFSFVGVVICSIVVGSRTSRTPSLLTGSYSKTAGLQIVGYLLVLALAGIFGAITAVCLRLFLTSKLQAQPIQEQKPKEVNAVKKANLVDSAKQQGLDLSRLFKGGEKLSLSDNSYLLGLEQEQQPLHYDLFVNIKQLQKDNYTFVKEGDKMRQVLSSDLANPLRTMLIQKHITAPAPQAERNKPIQISRTFTRDNLHKNVEVSEMKKIDDSELEHHDQESQCRYLPLESNKPFRQQPAEDNLGEGQKEVEKGGDKRFEGIQPGQKGKYYETEQFNRGGLAPEIQRNKEDSNISGILPSDYDSRQDPILKQKDDLGMVNFGENMLVSKATQNRKAVEVPSQLGQPNPRNTSYRMH